MTVDTLGRVVRLYQRTALTRSAIVLLIANAIPIVGVLFFGWSLITILVLFWLENGIVGFWNVPKIALARGALIPRLTGLPPAAVLLASANPEAAEALQAARRDAQAEPDPASPVSAAPASATPGSAAGDSNALSTPSTGPVVSGPMAPGGSQSNAIPPTSLGRLSLIPSFGLAMFFTVHYGIFWLVHGVFVFLLPTFGGFMSAPECLPSVFGEPGFPGAAPCSSSPFGEILWLPIAIAGVALFISHGASFFLNYIGRGESLRATPGGQMMAPYGRVIVLHITIILGSFIVAMLGAPIGALLILVVLKSAFDLGLRLREHRKVAIPVPPAATA